MTKRHSGYVVILEDNLREDEAEATLNALRMVKGVIAVQPVIHDPVVEIEATRRDIAWQTAIRKLKPPARGY
jgi:uncharacterized Fe-S cluster-containing protein